MQHKSELTHGFRVYYYSVFFHLFGKFLFLVVRYIDFKETKDDFNFAERFTALKAEFEKQLKEEARLNELIKENLDKINIIE